ncbi:CinA family nicotinamide mononucleotide deamidase-related protein [Moheibacter sediminis]|uniref:CinA-like protein n=1 Tax=Moheibacter sediminis TaxID=1434700 RepID=A0A1W2AFS7_9FLAO|nr:CinA family nicotinamide mononucleotide deamidase-related protein [Moheibacter sediminis]SMC59555.1 nicotinamide-nucleotide amidase [Moheibacter sediminis]
MKVRLVTIGDEILIGQIVDSNSAYIAKKLNEIGLEVEEILSIHDDSEIIIETLNRILPDSDVIITTGGLGPTKDDVTKNALCEFLQTELVMDEEILAQLEERYLKLNRTMNELNRAQALMPQGSIALKNALGTAPGIWTEFQDTILINLQGVPFEMKNLIKTEVVPRLQEKFDLPFVVHRFLSVSNYPESDLAIALTDWEDNLPSDFHFAYLPERSKVKLRISAKGNYKTEIENRIEAEVQKLIPIIGSRLDSRNKDSIELILGEKLKELNLTISTAESCTGGTIATMLTSAPGSSNYFYGSVVSYATSVKENILKVPNELIENYTVVSKEVAAAMAKGVRELLKTDIAVSTTGVAGPAQGEDGKEVGTVWIAVTDGNSTETKMYFFPYLEREDFISQVSKLALQNVFEFVKIKN